MFYHLSNTRQQVYSYYGVLTLRGESVTLFLFTRYIIILYSQVACAIRELVTLAGGADKAHVICGDFNSWSGTAIYQLTNEGYLNDQSMTALQAIHSVQLPEGQVNKSAIELQNVRYFIYGQSADLVLIFNTMYCLSFLEGTLG